MSGPWGPHGVKHCDGKKQLWKRVQKSLHNYNFLNISCKEMIERESSAKGISLHSIEIHSHIQM